MTKWADYLISAVQYNTGHTHIVKVIQHVDSDDKFGDGYEATRSTVVSNLATKTYMTIRKNKTTSKWEKGDNVIRYSLVGEYFIRTDGNETKSDNLGELPEF